MLQRVDDSASKDARTFLFLSAAGVVPDGLSSGKVVSLVKKCPLSNEVLCKKRRQLPNVQNHQANDRSFPTGNPKPFGSA
jgi:hypothetical protein